MNEYPIILGRHHTHDTPLALRPADRERHFYCVGKTGMGKSTLQLNMIMQDLLLGHGVCLIDPHGKAAEDVLRHMPARRAEDLVYLNPADPTHSVGLNPLDVPENQPSTDRRPMMSSSGLPDPRSSQWILAPSVVVANGIARSSHLSMRRA
jgi:hypothetical protein